MVHESGRFRAHVRGTSLARSSIRSIVTQGKKVDVSLIRMTTTAALLASVIGFQAAPVVEARDASARYEDRWERNEDQRNRAKQRAKRNAREARREAYWDASRYYRQDDRRYRSQRLGRNDRIYRGSDNRYYCKRDDGTTGLIIGGISGAVLGSIIAPGESKVLGTIIGAGAGALIGRAIDDGDIVCR